MAVTTTTTIWVSLGQKRLIGGTITETTGKNISAGTILVALGPHSPPPARSSAVAPTSDAQGATTADRVVKLLIDNTTTLASGEYLWAWISDNPEIEPIRVAGPYRIA